LILAAVGFSVGSTYDYTDYMRQWTHVLAGGNPWQAGTHNYYGLGHQLLAPLFYVHPLAPKLLFIYCWFGIFVIVLEARRDNAAVAATTFLALFVTPFFVVLVGIYGVEDALVALLTLCAVDLRTRQARSVAPAILLAVAVLTKLYPLALVPFLATERGRIDLRFIIVFVAALAAGLELSILVWGWSALHIVEFAAARDAKMLSIFWFLSDSRLSPIAHTRLAAVLTNWNFAVVILAMMSLYALHFFGRMRALAGTILASVALLAAYKVGHPQYFICPATLLIYFLAVELPNDQRSKAGLVAATICYFVVLNAFELWYYATDGSFHYPQVRAFVGLPCLMTALWLMWQVIRWERARGRSSKWTPHRADP
jgi:hypothetical protein